MSHVPPPGRLTREKILAAVVDLLERSGAGTVTTRTIGEALQVHPTALYRHFRDMDELLREAADAILAGLGDEMVSPPGADAFDAVSEMCRRLRAALMAHPAAAQVMSRGPSRKTNERALTEQMLGLLSDAGLSDPDAAQAYHALVEFAVGSAAIDSLDLTDPDAEENRHRVWRADYLSASPDRFPHSVRMAVVLYPGMEKQFEYGLMLLIDGLRRRVAASVSAAATT